MDVSKTAPRVTGVLDSASKEKLDKLNETQSERDKTLKKNQQMDKDAFLRILSTQLRYQDPMNPVSDKEFMGQMAQFTTLEQTNNMAAMIKQNVDTSKEILLVLSTLNANITKLLGEKGSGTQSTGGVQGLESTSSTSEIQNATQTAILNELIQMNKRLAAYEAVGAGETESEVNVDGQE